jgi:hypothetical protein
MKIIVKKLMDALERGRVNEKIKIKGKKIF